jgi:tetratricopeptide (TPR) repeat protein
LSLSFVELPGYTIEREIGRGGMARVYLAVQKKFGRLVAIKVVSSQFTNDPSFGRRFVREARIIGQLSHPNIVQVYDAGVENDAHYLVMEYLRGGDLNRRFEDGMHIQAVLAVVKDMARALDYAHQKGYVHRDIKPENILFREDGSAVLSDFGIAKVLRSEAPFTRHGTVVGTPQYMSPEQAAGRQLDGRSDLYSLGVVFFRMLTGDVPYDADSAVSVGIKHLQEPIPRLPGHLEPFQHVIDRVLAKRPEDRYQTGAELIAGIDRVRADGLVPNTVIRSTAVTTAEIRVVSDSMLTAVREPALRPGSQRYVVRRRASVGRKWALAGGVAALVAAGVAYSLYPERDALRQRALAVVGIHDGTKVADAWRQAQSLRGDRNQSLASIVAGYRRVLALEKDHPQALAALASLADEWKTVIAAALAAHDLPLAQAKLEEALGVFPSDEGLVELSSELANRQRAGTLLASTQALLRSHGLSDLPSATSAIQSLQEVLRLDPGNQTARAELDRLADQFVVLARASLESGDVTGAMSHLERAATANPEFVGLAAVRDKIGQATSVHDEIQGLLQQASALRAAGALISPAGANAAEIYHRVLATDPQNSIAHQGLNEVVASVLANADAQLHAGQLDDVRSMVTRAAEIGLDDAATTELKRRLRVEEQRVDRVATLLSQARSLAKDGYLTEPPSGNAVSRALEVLRLDPSNDEAREVLRNSAARLATVAQEAYAVGLVEDAKHYLELALTVTPDVPEWRALRESWNTPVASTAGAGR